MVRYYSFWLLALGLFATMALVGCSSNSGTDYGNNNVSGGTGAHEFDSGNIAAASSGYYGNTPGGAYQHVFNTAEVAKYYCKFHGGPNGSGMSGVITVQAGGSPSTYQVSITNSAFSPAALTISVGSTVKWTNNSTAVHTVTSDK